MDANLHPAGPPLQFSEGDPQSFNCIGPQNGLERYQEHTQDTNVQEADEDITIVPEGADDVQEAEDDIPAESADICKLTGLYCKEGNYAQPVIQRLSLNDDRVDFYFLVASQKATNKKVKDVTGQGPKDPTFYFQPEGQTLTYGGYTLKPESWKVGFYRRFYRVHHVSLPDSFMHLRSHPVKGVRGRVCGHLENHVLYQDRTKAIQLALDLLEAIEGVSDAKISYYEVAGDSVDLKKVFTYILESEVTRKNGGEVTFKTGAKRIVKGVRAGSPKSDLYFRLYNNGVTLKRRNRQYIGRIAQDVGVLPAGNDLRELFRLEVVVKGKSAKELTYRGADGVDQDFTLRSLLDPAVRLSVFRLQIESGFVFRLKGKRSREYHEVPFFDWELIGASNLVQRKPRKARKSNSVYAAKQALHKLLKDRQPGDYLVPALTAEIERACKVTFLKSAGLFAVIDTIVSEAGNLTNDQLVEMLTMYVTEAAAQVGHNLGRDLPGFTAETIATEHDVLDYFHQKRRITSRKPTIHLPVSPEKSAA